ncbi:DUF5777 family beta-barrel protein [Winogradskyella sp. A2]|uniref:DUF5777 family beta-barrel protein n=1 Tax=Winogradskyella sp. A2 TaxID=3366944 RepID=UPI00398C6649
MKKNSIILVILSVVFSLGTTQAQSLLDSLEKEMPKDMSYTAATFKTTRISIGHSVETRKKGTMEVSAFSSFWNIPNADIQSFVADKVNTRFGIDYAFSDRFTFGAGASTWDGILDAFGKYRLMRQGGEHNNFLNITLLQTLSYRTKKIGYYSQFDDFSDKAATTSQVLIARKFNPKLSLQIAPTFVHRSGSGFDIDPNNQFALGFGGRYKVGQHVSIVSEYYYVANELESTDTYGAFALGVNWEMSDLMLQFNFTNARNLVDDMFITQTTNNFNFNDGNFHFGFKATYIIHFKDNSID